MQPLDTLMRRHGNWSGKPYCHDWAGGVPVYSASVPTSIQYIWAPRVCIEARMASPLKSGSLDVILANHYDSSILSTSAFASSQVSLFFFAHSIWLLAYASCEFW
jgi:hypothetical protein